MGKFVTRLSSRKKAKRWVKGQSASSNPETKKYRDQARSSFFQQNVGSELTINALRQHDAIQGTPMEGVVANKTPTESEATTTFKTFDTYATDYSNCSNVSFTRFLSYFQSNSAVHKEMLAILAAVTEVIKENGGTESSTEYYAALMTTLESAETPESVSAILSLLGMGMKTVPKNVLRFQFGQASAIFLQILCKYTAEENFLILRHCIGCLAILLRHQEAVSWSDSSTTNVLDAILAFTIHTKPKIRKAAQRGICAILKGSDIMKCENPPAYHPAAPTVAKHCLTQLKIAAQPGQMTSTLHMLSLLKDVIHEIPKSQVKAICEAILSIMTLNNVLLTSCCLQTLHGLFVSKPTEVILPPQLNAQIINALYDYQPAPGDTQPTLAWLAVMQEAYCNLAINSLELCAANFPKIIEKCTELWSSDKSDVHTGTSHTLKALLENCVTPICENDQISKQCKPVLIKTINLIQEGMKYQYNSAWQHVLHLLAVTLKIIGPHCQDEAKSIIVALAELRESFKFSYNAEIEYAVGAAIQSLGPEVVLKAIPLQNHNGDIDLKRSWLLPVLRDCVNKASLSYYINSLLPLAKSCENKSKILKEQKDGIGAHSSELLVSQIWALLPCFCNSPPDIKDNFKKIAEILGVVIRDRKDLRIFAMAALRKLIKHSVDNNNQQDINEIAWFAKNYLPLLCNLYITKPHGTDEEGQRLAAYETIKIYLVITKKEYICELFDNAMIKMTESISNDSVKESIFDLIRLLTQYTDISRIKILYEKCIGYLQETKCHKDQKKAYRFLEEICGNESEACKQFTLENRKEIQKVILKAVSTVLKPSKGSRIRCIGHLVNIHPQLEKTKFLKAIVPEAIMCIKELNEKCRLSAYNLLKMIGDKFLNNEEHFMEYVDLITQGLKGEPIYCSATLLALSSITYHYNCALGMEKVNKILDEALTLSMKPSREIVMSALSFVKVYITVFQTATIAAQLQKIVLSLTNMAEDCKRHFRQKVRDIIVKLIRKFGIDTITKMVPVSDTVMHKRLKNIRKIQARKQKLKEKDNSLSNDDTSQEDFNVKKKPKTLEEILADSDDDFDDAETTASTCTQRTRKTKKKAWIQENEDNIIDFVDPTNATKSISTTQPGLKDEIKPKNKEKDYGFKTAPDGRLIIKDDEDDSDTDDAKKSKKKSKKLSHLASDSEDDYVMEEDDKSVMTSKSKGQNNKKRKLNSDTQSVPSASMYRAGGSGIHRPLKKQKQEKGTGSEYKSKKGQGDVKLKGKPDPYAYIPLRRATLKRRNKGKNSGDFKRYFAKGKGDKKVKGGKRR